MTLYSRAVTVGKTKKTVLKTRIRSSRVTVSDVLKPTKDFFFFFFGQFINDHKRDIGPLQLLVLTAYVGRVRTSQKKL